LALSDRKFDEAIELFRQAHQVNPSDPTVSHALSETLIRSGKTQEGEKVALELIAKQKSYGPIYDQLYNLYVAEKRAAEAENILKAKVNNNPTQADYVFQLARYYAGHNKAAEMNSALQMLLNRPSDFPQARLQVGDFYLGLRNFEEAKRYYKEAENANLADKLAAQKRLIGALNAEGNRDEAVRLAEETVKENPKDEEALGLRADLWLETGKPDDLNKALQEFKNLSAQNPSDAILHYQLGRAELLKRDLNSARSQFAEAVRLRSGFIDARYRLAEISLTQHHASQALQQASDILSLRPNDLRGRILHAAALMSLGNRDGARSELDALIRDFPQVPEPKMLLGELMRSEKKFPEAAQIFGKAGKDDPRAILGLAGTYASQHQVDKAIRLLSDALTKSPDSSLLREGLASMAAQAGQFDLAIREYQKLLDTNPKSTLACLHLGQLYEGKNDYSDAIAMYRRAQQLSPNDAGPAILLAQALATAGQSAEAVALYQKVLSLHPDHAVAMNNLAFLLSETGGNMDEALKLAQRAVQKAPGNALFADTAGYVYLKKGMRDIALRTFENLVQKYPRSSTFHYHLGMALFENGDKAGAKKQLDAALAQHPASGEESQIRQLVHKIG
jgi:tetratricopeptide (TPR) repeat protein